MCTAAPLLVPQIHYIEVIVSFANQCPWRHPPGAPSLHDRWLSDVIDPAQGQSARFAYFLRCQVKGLDILVSIKSRDLDNCVTMLEIDLLLVLDPVGRALVMGSVCWIMQLGSPVLAGNVPHVPGAGASGPTRHSAIPKIFKYRTMA